ncbi:MAG: 3-dehydroquinate synthase [Spirochaetes bacterium]|nr:3-dehydroquinate synthase [Spirochaetota bacterium]
MTGNTITVNTERKKYDVIIGDSILPRIGKLKDQLLKERLGLIVSSRVNEIYKDYIINSFKDFPGYDIFLMKDGEENKNYRYAEEFLNLLLARGYTRKSAIVGIGGGVVGDFAGFVAALYMRGLPVIHVPTTLLAMVDSSIGGKVAVNLSAGKNMVGAFYQPDLVISDISFIQSLPENELKNGLTEVLKHGMIGEDALLETMSDNGLSTIRNPENIFKIVFLSAKFKSSIVGKDEKESGLRAILNFGHTAGHAIESLMGYKGISHGEAVAIGIKIEMEISRRLGWMKDDEIDKINGIIEKFGLIYNKYELNPDEVVRHMKYDKKNSGGSINFALIKGIGNPVYNQPVDENLIKEIIKGYKN